MSFHWDIDSGSEKKLGIHTTEFLFKEDLKVVSASQVAQQFEKAEGPALYAHFGGNINSAHKHSESVTDTVPALTYCSFSLENMYFQELATHFLSAKNW